MCLWAIEDTKREAGRLVVEGGLGVREVERNLGISFGVVKGWVQKQRDHQDTAFVGNSEPLLINKIKYAHYDYE